MHRRPKQVMVIEDDPDCLEAVCDVLRYQGYDVVAVRHGGDALRYLDANPPPDLILVDLMMPVMDGVQFLDEQRAHPTLSKVPVALLSAERHLDDRAKALGAAGSIAKPVDYDGLVSTVRKLAGDPT
jgi:CheY-like chemotaxis protein